MRAEPIPHDTGEGRWLEQPFCDDGRPWIASYGKNAPAFRIGWMAGRAEPDAAGYSRRCPFKRGTMAAAAWRASRAFQAELRQ